MGCNYIDIKTENPVDATSSLTNVVSNIVDEIYYGAEGAFGREDLRNIVIDSLAANFYDYQSQETLQVLCQDFVECFKSDPDFSEKLEEFAFILEIFNDPTELQNLLIGNQNANKPSLDSDPTLGSKEIALDDPEAASDKRRHSFITDAYRTAVGAKSRMEQTMWSGIVTALMYDNKNKTFVQSPSIINENIRDFQEQLFEIVLDWFGVKPGLYKLYASSSNYRTYYTGAFEQFLEDFKEELALLNNYILINDDGVHMSVAKLNVLDSEYDDENKPNSKKLLDAYNAYFILTHFDDLMHIALPQLKIRSKLWNSFDLGAAGLPKYTMGVMSNTEQSWLDLERDISAADLLNDQTKALIQNIKFYEWHLHKTYSDNKLSIADFNRIITHIKRLAFTEDALVLIDIASPLGKKIREIYGKDFDNLFQIIGSINSNAPTNFKNLFLLLTSDEFWNTYALGLDGETNLTKVGLEQKDLSIIWSLYKGVFELDSKTEEPSLYQRWKNDPRPDLNYNYFNFIVQACASIEAISLQQYIIKLGEVVNRTLRDSVKNALERLLERAITYNFSPLRPIDFKRDYCDKYRPIAEVTKGTPIDLDYLFRTETIPVKLEEGAKTVRKEVETKRFHFLTGLDGFDVYINPTDSNFSIRILKGDEEYTSKKAFTREDLISIIPFLKDMLPALKIKDVNSGFIKEYVRLRNNNYDIVVRLLLNLGACVFMNASLLQVIKNSSSNYNYNSFLAKVKSYYGDNTMPGINTSEPQGGFRSLIPAKLKLIIEGVANAYNTVEGIYGDSIVRDSDGKMINLIGMSMLATKVEQQIVTLNSRKDSASKHFSLWKQGLYKGTQFTREFAGDSSTQATSFNVNEHTLSQLIYDFLGGYCTDSNDAPLNDVGIMPSILSDKSRILKVLLNMDRVSPIKDAKGNPKKYRDLTADEWKTAASIELGTFYYNIWKNVTYSYDTLNTYLRKANITWDSLGVAKTVPNGIVQFDYWNNFAEFNKLVLGRELNPGKILHLLLLSYLKNNPNSSLEVADQIHYVLAKESGKRVLRMNPLLASEIYRFSQDGKLTITNDKLGQNSRDFERFADWVEKTQGKKLGLTKDILINNLSTINADTLELLAASYRTATGIPFYLSNYFIRIDDKLYINQGVDTLNILLDLVFCKLNDKGTYIPNVWSLNILDGKYKSNKLFWEIKQNDLIKGLLRNGCIIKTTDGAYKDLTEKDSEANYRNTIQKQLVLLKHGVLDLSKIKAGDPNQKWYDYGSGWIAIARLKCSRVETDEAGNPVIKNGKKVVNEYWLNITSEADVRGLSYTIKKGKEEITVSYGDDNFSFYDLVEYNPNYKEFLLNPCIDTWNAVDFMVGLEYMNSTVGTHLNHPAKKLLGKDDLKEEAERWLALVKRNVSLSATKHSFALGLLNGIRDKYRIAVVEDDEVVTFNVYGAYADDGAKPYDGVTFVCGANNYLENNSLAGSSAGTVKKQFVHSYKEETGTGIIIKTAGFALTNANIRVSEFYARMNKKMMQGRWKTKDGKDFVTDITKNYFGDTIKYEPIYYYDEDAGKYFKITKIESKGKNQYRVCRKEVNENGDIIGGADYFDASVNSNYDLWKLFGGENSKELVYDEASKVKRLVDSENSFKNLVTAMNSISEDTGKFNKKDNIPESQADVYLNLKYSNIDYIVTAGAIKLGAANVNSKDAYFKDDYELTTMEISMHDSGILLDAEHEADESTLSIMTLVVNALCARGYSLDSSTEVYRAMLALTENGIKDQLEGLKQWLDVKEGSKETLQDALADIIVKGLRNLDKREGSLVEAVAETIIQEAKEGKRIRGKNLTGVMPFSHPAMFRQLTSMLSSAFTKQGIKIKFDGSLAVMNPSNGIWKIYGGKLLRDYYGDKNGKNLTREEALLEALREADSKPLSQVSDIRLGFHYKITDAKGKVLVEDLFIQTPLDYWNFRLTYGSQFYKNEIKVSENVIVGRDLATYQANFKVEGKDHAYDYNMWDLDVIRDLYAIKELHSVLKDLDVPGKTLLEAYLISRNEAKAKLKTKEEKADLSKSCALDQWIYKYIPAEVRVKVVSANGEFNVFRLLDYLNNTWIKNEVRTDNFKSDVLNEKLISKNLTPKANINNLKLLEKLLRRELLSNLFAIGSGKDTEVKIYGERRKVIKGSTKVNSYELIMPKIYATKFGLKKGDTLNDIMSKGEDFFLERAIEHWQTTIHDENLFDIELKHSNGNHIYVLYKDNNDKDRFVSADTRNTLLLDKLKRKLDIKVEWDGNRLWRIDRGTDEKVYRMASEEDEVWLDEDDNEIIVTKNPQFYVEVDHYSDIRLSKGANSTTVTADNKLTEADTEIDLHLDELLKILKNVDNREVKNYLAFITPTNTEQDRLNLILAINFYADKSKDLTIANYREAIRIKDDLLKLRTIKALSILLHKARERFISFKESLNILAARIPAQSMQSFMAMKVVGFDDAGVNNAYVNYWQIWLQGSDFDIDKVSLLGTSYTADGHFVKWSPAFNISSDRYMLASKTLPFPTGLKTNKEISRLKGDLSIYNSIMESRELFLKPIWKLEPDEIIKLGQIIREINSMSVSMNKPLTIYYPKDISPEDMSILDKAINMIDKHNDYLNTARDKKHMITNFITTYMIKVSEDPANLIQSQSSVDEMTAGVKNKAEGSKMATRTNGYAPGNVESKMETLILTLTGKENVGIVASAMKTFEALSYYFNHRIENIGKYAEILNGSFNKEDISKIEQQAKNILLGKNLKGLLICGQYVKLLANTYVNNAKALSSNIESVKNLYLALQEVNNDTDAFLLISALLSLATDNAKDPTLSKINASPDMIGLYTAGIAMGIEFDRLVETIMSETGDYIAGWINGNVFLRVEKRRLDQVLRFIKEGPELNGITPAAMNRLNSAIICFRADNSKLYKTKEEIEKIKEEALSSIERLDAEADEKLLTVDDKDILRARLNSILRDYGTKGILTIFRTALEIDLPNYQEMLQVMQEIKEKEAELEENEDENAGIELHKLIMEAKDKLKNYSLDSKQKRTRRVLENLLLEYLDYGFKKSRIDGEYKSADGTRYKVLNPFTNRLRTNPWECHNMDLAYIETISVGEGKLAHNITIARKVVEFEASDLTEYKEQHKAWVEQWNELKKELYKDYKTRLKKYEEMMAAYKEHPEAYKKKPTKPVFQLSAYKRAFLLHRLELQYQQFIAALEGIPFDPTKYLFKNVIPTTNFLETIYPDTKRRELVIAKINKLVMAEPLAPMPKKLVFSKPVQVFKVLDSITVLSKINNEMGTLRDRLKLNQGLPNAFGEQLAALHSFKNIIINRTKDEDLNLDKKQLKELADQLDGTLELDLHKFVANTNGYRDRAIAVYEKVKYAFNVLDAVWEVPHYRGYLEDFDVLINSGKALMIGYRSTEQIGDKVAEIFRYNGGDKLISVYNLTSKFILNVLNNNFLRTKQLTITIPPGYKFFNSNGDLVVATTQTQIVLGTPHGNASFKLWFEEYVVPSMKSGFFGKYKEVNGKITKLKEQNNVVPKFIRELLAIEIDKTVTGNATVSYSLPISMLPRSESEWELYRKYKDLLNRLNVDFYQQGIDPRTGEIVQTAIPFKNLLFIYNIIAYGSENTLNAFSSMFEDMLRDGSLPIQQEYVKFLSEFDTNTDLVEGEDYGLLDLIYWCAPIVSDPRLPRLPKYIRYYDESTMRYVLLLKKDKNDDPNNYAEHRDVEPLNDNPDADLNNVKRVSPIEDSDYFRVRGMFTNSQFFIRDITALKNSKIFRVSSLTSVVLTKQSLIDKLKYKGKEYTPLQLIDLYKTWIDNLEKQEAEKAANENRRPNFNRAKYEARIPKITDFKVPTETLFTGGTQESVPSRDYVNAIIEEIFNPCA